MDADLQQIIALALVALAVASLILRGRRRNGRKSCGEGCSACPTEKLRR